MASKEGSSKRRASSSPAAPRRTGTQPLAQKGTAKKVPAKKVPIKKVPAKKAPGVRKSENLSLGAGKRRNPNAKAEANLLARRRRVQKGRERRRLAFVLIPLILIGLIGVTFGVAHSKLFAARVVRISGLAHISRTQVLKISGLAQSPPLVDVGQSTERKIETIPWVKSATVAGHFPDSVTVAVQLRQPVAAVKVSTTPATFALVDGHGFVIADVSTIPATVLPLVTGVTAPTPGHYLRGDHGAVALAQAIPKAWRGLVTAISAAKAATVSVTLSLPATVSFGRAVNLAAKCEAVAAMVANGSVTPGSHLDVSVPAVPEVSG